MNSSVLIDFFNFFKNDNLSFIYQGAFSDEITGRIIDLTEKNITNVSGLSRFTNKISFLLAECYQNIVRHGETDTYEEKEYPTGMFITRNIGSCVYIISCNMVEEKQVVSLTEQLENINNLSKEQLKDLHLKVLADNRRTEKGGAGLGLIEMARKSGHKLDYDFERYDDRYSFFYLQVKLQVADAEEIDTLEHNFNLEVAKDIYDKMRERNILMVCKGDFQQGSIIPILKMIENNIQQQFRDFIVKKRTYHMLVEILQNIGKHSYQEEGRREGVFLMSVEDNYYSINAANYIHNNQILKLTDHLEKVNNMSKEELNEVYHKILIKGKVSDSGSVGLGLIDVAKESRDKLNYDFIEVDDEKSYFTLGATLNI